MVVTRITKTVATDRLEGGGCPNLLCRLDIFPEHNKNHDHNENVPVRRMEAEHEFATMMRNKRSGGSPQQTRDR
jgi:hypothetical protein